MLHHACPSSWHEPRRSTSWTCWHWQDRLVRKFSERRPPHVQCSILSVEDTEERRYKQNEQTNEFCCEKGSRAFVDLRAELTVWWSTNSRGIFSKRTRWSGPFAWENWIAKWIISLGECKWQISRSSKLSAQRPERINQSVGWRQKSDHCNKHAFGWFFYWP